jgi:uncharacterized protein YuzE
MKLTYDSRYNVAYLRFHEKVGTVNTMKISDELNIDMSPDGTVYGIELLNANEQILSEDAGNLVVVNESAGKTTELLLK